MNVLTQINSVNIYECNNKYDSEMTLEEFESEPAFYKDVIRPMLTAGHEGELLNWLKTMGILECSRKCNSIDNGTSCQGAMTWVHARIVDNFQWKCTICTKKSRIRENSIFDKIRCRFNDAIRIFAGWSKGTDVETLAKLLCIKKQSVLQVYDTAAQIANKYIKSNLIKWKIGGPKVIVLVDVFPEGFAKLNNQENTRRANTVTSILCLAEVKEIPTRYWLQVLDSYHVNSVEQKQNVNTSALQIIQEVVLPGSILVTNFDSQICSYDTLQSLKHLYPVIVTIEGIKRHDKMNELINNLETIWQPCANICNEAMFYAHSQMQNYIVSELWRRQFKDDSFEMLINQMFGNFS